MPLRTDDCSLFDSSIRLVGTETARFIALSPRNRVWSGHSANVSSREEGGRGRHDFVRSPCWYSTRLSVGCDCACAGQGVCEHERMCTVHECRADMGAWESHSLDHLTSLPSQLHLPSVHRGPPSSGCGGKPSDLCSSPPSHLLFLPLALPFPASSLQFKLHSAFRSLLAPRSSPVSPLAFCASKAFEPPHFSLAVHRTPL